MDPNQYYQQQQQSQQPQQPPVRPGYPPQNRPMRPPAPGQQPRPVMRPSSSAGNIARGGVRPSPPAGVPNNMVPNPPMGNTNQMMPPNNQINNPMPLSQNNFNPMGSPINQNADNGNPGNFMPVGTTPVPAIDRSNVITPHSAPSKRRMYPEQQQQQNAYMQSPTAYQQGFQGQPQGQFQGQSGFQQPGAQPGFQQPGVQPGFQQPGVQQPGVQPGYQQSQFSNVQQSFGAMSLSSPLSLPMIQLNGPPQVHDIHMVRDEFVAQRPYGDPNIPLNSPLDFHRSTLNRVPTTSSLLSKSKLVFGLVVSPFHPSSHVEGNVPVISSGLIVRCRRCRTYINPYVQFEDQGSRWRCNLCGLTNEMPSQFDYDMQTQAYVDRSNKVEFSHAVVEYLAPSEYMVRPPQPLVILFLLDLSFPAVQCGLVELVCQTILESIDRIPNEQGRVMVGFIGYDSVIHYFGLGGEPKEFIVSDLDDPFLPLPNDLAVNLAESRDSIETLLKKILPNVKGTQDSTSALGPCINAAQQLIAPMGGRIMIFQAMMPNVGEGALKAREEAKHLGTTKENALLAPSVPFYKNYAIECSRNQVAVDMFVVSGQYIDLATLGCSIRYSGGNLFYYPTFNSKSPDGYKFAYDLSYVLSRPVGMEAVLRIRASKGITITGYHGSFFLRSTDLLALPGVSPDNSVGVQFAIEEPLTGGTVCFQSALLYTSCHGERRIRVITSCCRLSESLSEVMTGVDQGAMFCLLAKMAVEKSLVGKLEDARDALANKCIDVMGVLKTIANDRSGNSLSALDNLKQWPVLILAILKHEAFRNASNIGSDARTMAMSNIRNFYIHETIRYVFPEFYCLTSIPDSSSSSSSIVIPPRLNLTSECLDRSGMFLLNDGHELILWIGRQIPVEYCIQVFDKPAYEAIPNGKMIHLPVLDNPLSVRIRNIIDKIRETTSPYFLLLNVVKEDSEPLIRMKFLWKLVEDKLDSSLSYPQWLSHLKEKIITIISSNRSSIVVIPMASTNILERPIEELVKLNQERKDFLTKHSSNNRRLQENANGWTIQDSMMDISDAITDFTLRNRAITMSRCLLRVNTQSSRNTKLFCHFRVSITTCNLATSTTTRKFNYEPANSLDLSKHCHRGYLPLLEETFRRKKRIHLKATVEKIGANNFNDYL